MSANMAIAAAKQAKEDELLRLIYDNLRAAFVLRADLADVELQGAIMTRLPGLVGEAITSTATLKRLRGSCILILEVPGRFAQAVQDAACARRPPDPRPPGFQAGRFSCARSLA